MDFLVIQNPIYLVGKRLKAHPGAVERGGLLGVAHPPLDMVELQEPKQRWNQYFYL